jgi:hypothetical protein
VLAATRAQAIDAAEIVSVDHDPLPVVTDSGRALDAERRCSSPTTAQTWSRSSGK